MQFQTSYLLCIDITSVQFLKEHFLVESLLVELMISYRVLMTNYHNKSKQFSLAYIVLLYGFVHNWPFEIHLFKNAVIHSIHN
ncbi:uncharacterized protein OCT59_025525 [Rhizophagus irregularis]|uniref:uncharacterized protein n=1 Tax=Rhizophagus irregularis TaxID=588596 RepID=UPI001C1B5A7C|nr:hypothetical protein OCT59_025525 [Rhizophagus irregularis]CAB4464339.1 unnamed protein product [Rhizophagus irregularis]